MLKAVKTPALPEMRRVGGSPAGLHARPLRPSQQSVISAGPFSAWVADQEQLSERLEELFSKQRQVLSKLQSLGVDKGYITDNA